MFKTDYVRVIAFAIAFFICMMGIGLLGWGIVIVPERGAYCTVVDYVEAVCGKS